MQVDAQHGLKRKRWPSGSAFWVIRGDAFDQCSPWHDFAHLLEEHLFAGFPGVQIELQTDLFRAGYFHRPWLASSTWGGSFAEFPQSLFNFLFISMEIATYFGYAVMDIGHKTTGCKVNVARVCKNHKTPLTERMMIAGLS
jgi:hypothetical protein